jgi:hypothetical protein
MGFNPVKSTDMMKRHLAVNESPDLPGLLFAGIEIERLLGHAKSGKNNSIP